MIARLREESGQAIVVSALFMTMMLGFVGLTLDVSSWYREHRQAQATADAAVLNGGQFLPADPATAILTAKKYGQDNGGGVEDASLAVGSQFGPNDTISVRVTRNPPGFFSKLFGVTTVSVHAKAAARVAIPAEARWAAPIVVNKLHPKLAGAGCPCFGPSNETTLPLGKTGAPGAFALVNLDVDDTTGTIGASTLAEWIVRGFDKYLPLGDYFSDPGAKWNDKPIQDALVKKFNKELLFPVYDTLLGSGSNAQYHIIGWVGFHLEDVTAGGSEGSLTGWFTRVIWDGIQNSKSTSYPDFGVRTIALVN